MEIVRSVFDCNTYVLALFNPNGVANRCFEAVRRNEVVLFVSSETVLEIREVLQRPKLIARFPNTTLPQIDAFLEKFSYLRLKSKMCRRNFNICAILTIYRISIWQSNRRADYIVSRDRDLLDLMTDFSDEAKEFRQRFRAFKSVESLKLLRPIQNIKQR
ncbi:MAG: putative toxin-antitoxin system toxin component, PIN family [Pyrinomonadaceae bacterium]|nr:putative toxin-antitoxin system toxin component, PIN family [Pyrinomonadaceae bacterium]